MSNPVPESAYISYRLPGETCITCGYKPLTRTEWVAHNRKRGHEFGHVYGRKIRPYWEAR